MTERVKKFINDRLVEKSDWLDYLLVFAAALGGFFAGWSIARVFALSMLVYLILRPVESLILGKLSIVFLFLTLAAVLLGQVERSEQLIQFSIFFAVLAALLVVYRRFTNKDD